MVAPPTGQGNENREVGNGEEPLHPDLPAGETLRVFHLQIGRALDRLQRMTPALKLKSFRGRDL